MASFEIEAMVRGYHIYKDVWSAVIDEEFPCKREDGNRFDPFTVAVCNGDIVIGHVPRKISSVRSLYIRRGGEIHCRVTGSRRFSADLEQGGLGSNFRSLNFRMLTWHTNYTKISTIRYNKVRGCGHGQRAGNETYR